MILGIRSERPLLKLFCLALLTCGLGSFAWPEFAWRFENDYIWPTWPEKEYPMDRDDLGLRIQELDEELSKFDTFNLAEKWTAFPIPSDDLNKREMEIASRAIYFASSGDFPADPYTVLLMAPEPFRIFDSELYRISASEQLSYDQSELVSRLIATLRTIQARYQSAVNRLLDLQAKAVLDRSVLDQVGGSIYRYRTGRHKRIDGPWTVLRGEHQGRRVVVIDRKGVSTLVSLSNVRLQDAKGAWYRPGSFGFRPVDPDTGEPPAPGVSPQGAH